MSDKDSERDKKSDVTHSESESDDDIDVYERIKESHRSVLGKLYDSKSMSYDEQKAAAAAKTASKDHMKLCYQPSQKENKEFAKASIDTRTRLNDVSTILVARMDAFERFHKYKKNYSIFAWVVLIKVYFQQMCLAVIKSKVFESICLLVIISNSILLVFQDPTADESNAFLDTMDTVFTILYTIEMALKIFGLGFALNEGSYLRDLWNVLDFAVVISAYVTIIGNATSEDSGSSKSGGSSSSLKSLRVLRVLRPLRTISSIQSLKVLILAFFGSLPLLLDTFTVMLLVFFVFAIAGLQLFSGLLRNRCFDQMTGIISASGIICGKVACSADEICGKMLDNPNLGNSNFDDILYSLLQVFVVTTMEGWTEIMGFVRDAYTDIAAIYFILIVFIGAFFVMNIMLAVIKAKFTEVHEEQKKLAIQNKLSKQKPQQLSYALLMRNEDFKEHFVSNRMKAIGNVSKNNTDDRLQNNKRKESGSRNNSNASNPRQLAKPQQQQQQQQKATTSVGGQLPQIKQTSASLSELKQRLSIRFKEPVNPIGEIEGEGDSSSSRSSSSSSSSSSNSIDFKGSSKSHKSKAVAIELVDTKTVNQSTKTKGTSASSKHKRHHASHTHRIRGSDLVDPNQKPRNVSKSFALRKQHQQQASVASGSSPAPPQHPSNEKSLQQPKQNKSTALPASNSSSSKVVFAGSLLLQRKPQQSLPFYENHDTIQTLTHTVETPLGAAGIPVLSLNQSKELDNFADEEFAFTSLNLNIRDFLKQSPTKPKNRPHIIFSKDAELKETQMNHSNNEEAAAIRQTIPVPISSKLIDPTGKYKKRTSLMDLLEDPDAPPQAAAGDLHHQSNHITSSGMETTTPFMHSTTNTTPRLKNHHENQHTEVTAALVRQTSTSNANKLLAIIKQTEMQRNKFVDEDNDKIEQQMQEDQEEEQHQAEMHLDAKQQEMLDKLVEYSMKTEAKLTIDFSTQPVATSFSDVMFKTLSNKRKEEERLNAIAMKEKRLMFIYTKKSERKALAAAALQQQQMPLTSKNINAMQLKIKQGKEKKMTTQSVLSSGSNKNGIGGGVGGVNDDLGGVGEILISNGSIMPSGQMQTSVTLSVGGSASSTGVSPRRILESKSQAATTHVYSFYSHLDVMKRIKRIQNNQQQNSVSSPQQGRQQQVSDAIQRKLEIVRAIQAVEEERNQKMISKVRVSNDDTKQVKNSAMKNKSRKSIKPPLNSDKDYQSIPNQKQYAWFAASTTVFGAPPQLGSNALSYKKMSIEEVRKVIFEVDDEDAPNVLGEHKEVEFDKIYEAMMITEFQKGSIQANIWNLDQVCPKYPVQQQNLIVNALNNQDHKMWIPGILGVWTVFSKQIEKIVVHSAFEKFIMLIVVMNTTLLALDGMFTDETTMNAFDTMNSIFTYTFIVELALKLSAFGIKMYVADTMNIFDGVIVLFSLVEIVFSSGTSALSAFKSVRIFRTFRVLRVTKLLRSLSFMKIIIGVVSRSIASFLNVALLLFLFLFIYSLLGWQIFSGKLNQTDSELVVRSNFDSFSHSFITVFQILTMENWQQVLYVTLSSSVNKLITILYLVSWIFIGNLSLLNLFLAILLDGFTNDDAQSDAKEVEKELSKIDNDEISETVSITTTKLFGNDNNSTRLSTTNTQKREEKKQDKEIRRILQNTERAAESGGQYISALEIEDIEQKLDDDDAVKDEIKREAEYNALQCEKSIFIFSKKSLIRRIAFRIYKLHQFDATVLVLIVLSSIKLAFDTYLSSDATADDDMMTNVSDKLDIVFNLLFALEAVIKIISLGFTMHEHTYLRDSWNRIDFIIVVTSLLDMFVDGIDLPALKILRMLRTLRPLRFVSHNVNIKVVVIALFQSMGAIFNVLIVLFLVYLMFAILGMSFLANKMGKCDVDNYYGMSRSDCTLMNAKWVNSNANFDNVGTSLITLYVIGTLEGWPDMMYTAVDGVGDGEAPVQNANFLISLFFVAFILVGSFFFLNLFIGAICFNFDQAHKNEKSSLYSFLTDEQRNWIEMQKMILRAKPDFSRFYVPKSKYRLKIFNAISSKTFEIGVMICIILNIITMAMSYEGMSQTLSDYLDYANYVFTGVFFIECVLSIFALGWKGYWIIPWNKFDFVVVVTSMVDIFMTFLLSNSSSGFLRIGPQLIRIIRVMRVSRLLKLSKNLEGLQKILDTMVLSFPSMMNIGALTLLVIYIYSILACYLFGDVTAGTDVDDDTVNFVTFHNSIITLFRCATGEDWYVIMYDVSHTSDCIQGSTCGSMFAIPFFLTFILIGRFVMLNLFILVILNDFEEYHLRTDSPVEKFQTNLESFMTIWSKYTQEHRGLKIKDNKIVNFFQELLPPLGFKGSKQDKQKIASELMKLNIPNIDNYIYFNDLLFAAMKRVYGEQMAQHTSKELAKYIVQQEKQTKKQLGQINQKELTNLGEEYKALKPEDFSKLIRQTNPVVQGIFVRMTYMALRRYTGLVNEQKLHENDADARNRVVILTEYEEDDDDDDEYEDEEQEREGYAEVQEDLENESNGSSQNSSQKQQSNHIRGGDHLRRNLKRQPTRFIPKKQEDEDDNDDDDDDKGGDNEGDDEADNNHSDDDNQRNYAGKDVAEYKVRVVHDDEYYQTRGDGGGASSSASVLQSAVFNDSNICFTNQSMQPLSNADSAILFVPPRDYGEDSSSVNQSSNAFQSSHLQNQQQARRRAVNLEDIDEREATVDRRNVRNHTNNVNSSNKE